MIRTDSLRLKQVLLNLISNSVKFTRYGFIKLSCHIIEVEDKVNYHISNLEELNNLIINTETNLIEKVTNNKYNYAIVGNDCNTDIKSNRSIKVLQIIVEDSGLGISEKDLNYIKNTFKEEPLKIN
jgi:signal transduction histidine kinase